MARSDDLKRLLSVLWTSLEEAAPDKRAPIAGQIRAALAEVVAIEGEDAGPVEEGNGLVDFQKRLAERQPGANVQGRASR